MTYSRTQKRRDVKGLYNIWGHSEKKAEPFDRALNFCWLIFD